jgi:putative SOS response-associated peptidase YedK
VIVTTDATPQLAAIHGRMPLLVPRAAHAVWLDPRTGLAEVAQLVRGAPPLEAYPVGLAVNDPRNDEPSLIEPIDERS